MRPCSQNFDLPLLLSRRWELRFHLGLGDPDVSRGIQTCLQLCRLRVILLHSLTHHMFSLITVHVWFDVNFNCSRSHRVETAIRWNYGWSTAEWESSPHTNVVGGPSIRNDSLFYESNPGFSWRFHFNIWFIVLSIINVLLMFFNSCFQWFCVSLLLYNRRSPGSLQFPQFTILQQSENLHFPCIDSEWYKSLMGFMCHLVKWFDEIAIELGWSLLRNQTIQQMKRKNDSAYEGGKQICDMSRFLLSCFWFVVCLYVFIYNI